MGESQSTHNQDDNGPMIHGTLVVDQSTITHNHELNYGGLQIYNISDTSMGTPTMPSLTAGVIAQDDQTGESHYVEHRTLGVLE